VPKYVESCLAFGRTRTLRCLIFGIAIRDIGEVGGATLSFVCPWWPSWVFGVLWQGPGCIEHLSSRRPQGFQRQPPIYTRPPTVGCQKKPPITAADTRGLRKFCLHPRKVDCVTVRVKIAIRSISALIPFPRPKVSLRGKVHGMPLRVVRCTSRPDG
jgi:hypothetical protein